MHIFNKKRFDRAAIARPLGHCRIVGRSKQSRYARGASGRSSIHTFSARAPSFRAVFSRFPVPLHAHVPTTNQENVRMVLPLGRRWQQRAETRLTFFRGADNLPIHLCYNSNIDRAAATLPLRRLFTQYFSRVLISVSLYFYFSCKLCSIKVFENNSLLHFNLNIEIIDASVLLPTF